MIKNVIKRDGTVEPFSAEKINGWSEWASKTLGKNVDWSEVVINTVSLLPTECTSEELQDGLIRYCLNKKTWEYNRMAGRLYSSLLIRQIHDSSTYPTVKSVHEEMQKDGVLRVLDYSDEEYAMVEKIIDHNINLKYPHYSLHQNRKKYAIRNRVNGKEYETSQIMYMRMAMALSEAKDKSIRMQKVKDNYIAFAHHHLNVPTPFYINLGTHLKGYASCNIMTVKDSAKSLATADHISYMMTVMSAGIGYHIKTRSLHDGVRGGAIEHQGKLPYIRAHVGAISANMQCYGVGTKLLTKNGYIDFSSVTEDTLVAQVEDNGEISYVNPTAVMNYAYKGEMITFSKNGEVKSLITPNHRVIYSYTQGEQFYKVDEASKFNPSAETKFHFGANGKVNERVVFDLKQRLEYAYYSPIIETTKEDNTYTFNLSNLNDAKKEDFLSVLKSTDTLFKESNSLVTVNLDAKYADSILDLPVQNMSNIKAMMVIRELGYWSTPSSPMGEYVEIKTNDYKLVEKLQHIASHASIYTELRLVDNVYTITFDLMKQVEVTNNYTKGTLDYDDLVYCVSVPSGRLIVKYNEFTLLSGNSGRGGASTVSFNLFDPEIASLLKLKNPITPSSKQIRGADYSFGSNRLIMKKVARNEEMALFSFDKNHELYHAIYSGDPDYFERLYEEFLASDATRTMVSARKLVLDALGEEFDTGRMYENFLDTMNYHTPFLDVVYSSNLCQEIFLPTAGYDDVQELYASYNEDKNFILFKAKNNPDMLYKMYNFFKATTSNRGNVYALKLQKGDVVTLPESGNVVEISEIVERSSAGEVALCNIGGIIVSNIKDDATYAKTAKLALEMVHFGIHESEYVFQNLEDSAKARMNAGIGIVGLAHHMAKNGMSYTTQEGKNFIHELAETHYWHLLNASLELSKEIGNAKWMYKTKWIDGWTPLETYCREVDKIVTVGNKRDWKGISKRVVENGGHAFSVLASHMPSESCSKIDQLIRTEQGVVSLEDIFKLTGKNLEEELLEITPLTGGKWFDLNTPLQVDTLDGYKDCNKVWLNGLTNYMQIEMSNGSVYKVTHNHKFITSADGENHVWKCAIDLTNNDKLFNVDGTYTNISNIKVNDDKIITMDIEVDGVKHYILEDGTVSHNSSISGATTNGVYPIRDFHLNKTNDTLSLYYDVPDSTKLRDKYESAWDIEPKHITDLYAIIQKWTDQGISGDYWYKLTGDVKVKGSDMLNEYIRRYKLGLKSKYYNNALTSKKGILNQSEEELVYNKDGDADCEACSI